MKFFFAAILFHLLFGRFAAAESAPSASGLQVERLQVVGTFSTARPSKMTLKVKGLELAHVFSFFPTSGVSGAGTFDGEIPFHLGGAGIIVEQGKLTSRGGGQLRYHSDAMEKGLLSDALSDYAFSTMTIDVSIDAAGIITLTCQAEGHSRALNKPVNISVTVNDDLSVLRRVIAAHFGFRA